MDRLFSPADIVLPHQVTAQWPVVACDQFSAQPENWQEIARFVGNAPSTLHLIYPEAFLEDNPQQRITKIHQQMYDYLRRDILRTYPNSFVYLQRTLPDGRIRQGLVGKVDLQAYSYIPGEACPIRPTERTIPQRLPPRVRIRQGAPLEFPHVLALIDDPQCSVIEPLAQRTDTLPLLYDVPLWQNAGRVTGYLLSSPAADSVQVALNQVFSRSDMALSIGDGNHSLAAAKLFYTQLRDAMPQEEWMRHPARWALVEVENIHSSALDFAPIHRLVQNCAPPSVLSYLKRHGQVLPASQRPEPAGDLWHIPFLWGDIAREGVLALPRTLSPTAAGALQSLLEIYVAENPTVRLEYIHGDTDLRRLALTPSTLGFFIPSLEKQAFFSTVERCGILPLKTFSLGQALEKRFYIEGRPIIL